MNLSRADHAMGPPRVEIPREYNAADDLLKRNAGHSGDKYTVDADGYHTYSGRSTTC